MIAYDAGEDCFITEFRQRIRGRFTPEPQHAVAAEPGWYALFRDADSTGKSWEHRAPVVAWQASEYGKGLVLYGFSYSDRLDTVIAAEDHSGELLGYFHPTHHPESECESLREREDQVA